MENIKLIEQKFIELRNLTQNMDGVSLVAALKCEHDDVSKSLVINQGPGVEIFILLTRLMVRFFGTPSPINGKPDNETSRLFIKQALYKTLEVLKQIDPINEDYKSIGEVPFIIAILGTLQQEFQTNKRVPNKKLTMAYLDKFLLSIDIDDHYLTQYAELYETFKNLYPAKES